MDERRAGGAPGEIDMRARTGWAWRSLPLLLAGVAAGCSGDASAGDAPGEERPVRVINVEVREVVARPFTEVIRLTGAVEANRDVTLAAEEMGVVREILADKGSYVREGDAILRIEDRSLAAQVEQARAQASLARESWERRRRLWEEDRVGSELAFLEAKYSAEQAEAALEALEQRLARATIRAPFEGVVEARPVELGSMVSPGTPVARVVSLNPVKIVSGVPERFSADVRRGARVTVTFDIFPGEEYNGQVAFVGSTVNPQNRTFPVELTLPNPGARFKPEMVANVMVVRNELDEAVVVPQDALVRVEEGFVVFVVQGEGAEARAQVRPVVTGGSQQNQVVVTSGLEPGDRLVVLGQQQVANGDRVNVVAVRDGGGAR
jgi:membrane fusion protein, multidrug efflux system